MIQTVRKAWGIPELRKKIIFTLLILLIYRIGNAIAVPYVNTELLEQVGAVRPTDADGIL